MDNEKRWNGDYYPTQACGWLRRRHTGAGCAQGPGRKPAEKIF
ncbi:hypothetical protein X474_09525 [Dethiosulfatarculus sandiegensis]|uniref:Uncharacterized protein n=1 Tax=Dethiosulfatarculus sandiegensis TaxID=1429043 RepID=A0A0D2JXV8_9BACT|nr:hypothetical protein X474_09525 [Dethiosulfatarculus sandiegensis]